MPYQFYKVLHLAGIMMVFVGLGGYLAAAFQAQKGRFPGKRFAAISHGLGLLLALVGGFGLLARLGLVSGMPVWAGLKLMIWVALGGVLGLIARKPQWAGALWVMTIGLGATAAFLAIYKPV